MGGLGLSNTPSNPRSRQMTIPGPGADRANSVLPVLDHPSVPMRMWRCLLLTWLMGRKPSFKKLGGSIYPPLSTFPNTIHPDQTISTYLQVIWVEKRRIVARMHDHGSIAWYTPIAYHPHYPMSLDHMYMLSKIWE